MDTNVNTTLTPAYMSLEINELFAALAAFQATVKQPKLSKTVKVNSSKGNYSFRYADLAACVDAATPALKASGLCVTQLAQGDQLITILGHKSGQWISSVLGINPNKVNTYQDLGSALTYLKRYAYCSILGLVADEDDDANRACGNSYSYEAAKKTTPAPAKPVTKVVCSPAPAAATPTPAKQPETRETCEKILDEIDACKNREELTELWNKYKDLYPTWFDLSKGVCAMQIKKRTEALGVAKEQIA